MTSELKENAQSKKYRLAIISLTLITLGWVAGNWMPVLASSFSELMTGIMGVLMLYYTGNVGNKFVVGRHMVEAQKATTVGGSNGTNNQ